MERLPEIHPAIMLAIVVGAFALAWVVAWFGRRLLRGSLAAVEVIDPEIRAVMQARARQTLRGVQLLAYGSASLASGALALSFLGVKLPRWSPAEIVDWLLDPGIRIAVIIVAAYISIRAIHIWIEYIEYHATSEALGPEGLERRRRARTLSGTLANIATVGVAFAAALTVLEQLQINVLPILTGAGIAGLAIGFGAQNLVRDVISGFFLILENQVRVGDLAQIQNVTGTVEQINLRTIVLRDGDGAVHVFPNGTFTTLANLSKDFSYAVVDLTVPLSENFETVARTLTEIGARMQADAAIGPSILAPLEILGLESLGETNAVLRVRFRTAPLRQGVVARELRWRVVTEFAARGIKP